MFDFYRLAIRDGSHDGGLLATPSSNKFRNRCRFRKTTTGKIGSGQVRGDRILFIPFEISYRLYLSNSRLMFQYGLRTVRFMETMLPKCRMSFLYCCNSTVNNGESPRAIICVRLFGEVRIQPTLSGSELRLLIGHIESNNSVYSPLCCGDIRTE
jgi:hypothetical protein